MLLRIYAIHCFPVVDLGNFEILTICHIPYIFRTSAIWITAVPHLSLPPWLWCVNTVCYLVHKYFCLSRIDRFSSAVVAAQQWSRQTLWSNITYVNLSPKKVEKKDNMTERLRNCMRAVATRRKKKRKFSSQRVTFLVPSLSPLYISSLSPCPALSADPLSIKSHTAYLAYMLTSGPLSV